MDTLWNKIVDGRECKFAGNSKIADVCKVLSVDLSYVLSENPNTGKHNVVDELTVDQRLSHPKFIHAKGVVAKFRYIPYHDQSGTLASVTHGPVPDMGSAPLLCEEKMQGILRFGPANMCQINMLSFAFKFFSTDPKVNANANTNTNSMYNILVTGGSARNIDPKNPPNIGTSEVPFYATDISFIDTTVNKGANFLSKSFADLVENQNALDVSKFASGCDKVYFKLNPLLMKDFDSIKHDEHILENIKGVVSKYMPKIDSSDPTDDPYDQFELGYFYFIDSDKNEKPLGSIFLMTPMISSNYADNFLFFQHNLANVKPVTGKRTRDIDESNLNINPKSNSCCVFARRLGYFSKS